jgi:two-component system, NarL family, nitrate/nitrite response regulator NarL
VIIVAAINRDALQQPEGLAPFLEKPIRLLIVDEHALVRAGLRLLLDSQPGLTVVGEAADRRDALAAAIRKRPDIILLDLGDAIDVDCLPELLTAVPKAQVLVLTGRRHPETHRRAVRLGAMGLVYKEEAAEVLFQAIATLSMGEAWLDPSLIAGVLAELTRMPGDESIDPEAAKIATLSTREREIIALLGHGLKNRQIGQRLCITAATVHHHLTSIFAKLGVGDRLELMIYAFRHELARLPP